MAPIGELRHIQVRKSRLPSDPYSVPTIIPNALAGTADSFSSFTIFFSNITTWGPQAERYISDLSDDILCMAEHHQSDSNLSKFKAKLRTFGRLTSCTAASPTSRSATGTSAGLAISYKASIDAYPSDSIATRHACGVQDPMHARWHSIHLRLHNVTVTVVTLYLFTGEGLSERNLTVLEQVAVFLLSLNTPVIVVGDWQNEPVDLFRNGWPQRLGLVLVNPPGLTATCATGKGGARLLDFFLVSASLSPAVNCFAVYTVPWKPHIGLRLEVCTALRRLMVPTIRKPKELPTLPLVEGEHIFSHDTWVDAQQYADAYLARKSETSVLNLSAADAASLHPTQLLLCKRFARACTVMEAYTCLSVSIPKANIPMYLGRGHFPHCRLRPAILRERHKAVYRSPAANFWSRLDNILGWFCRDFHKDTTQHIIQLKSFSAHLSDHWSRSAAPNCPPHAWIRWLEELTVASVAQQHPGFTLNRVELWNQRAAAQKDAALKRSHKDARSNFKTWLSDSLCNAVGTVHAFTKDSVSSYISTYDVQHHFDQWHNLWSTNLSQDLADSAPPLGSGRKSAVPPANGAGGSASRPEGGLGLGICSAADVSYTSFCPVKWTPWKHQLKEAISRSFVDLGPSVHLLNVPRVFTVDTFRDAACSYPAKKKLGSDFLSPLHFRILPSVLIFPFVSVLNISHHIACWPPQIRFNALALTPKSSGTGTRPIAKTPMLYRMWCVQRADTVKQWSRDTCPEWEYAAEGKSALDAATLQQAYNDVALASNLQTGGILWDLEKFFDSIDHDDIRIAADRLNYPAADLKLALNLHSAPRFLTLSGAQSCLIHPIKGILQGCMHSVYLARMVNHRPISRIHQEQIDYKVKAPTRTKTFVDDIVQMAIGRCRDILHSLGLSSISLIGSMRVLKLAISPKSVIVASSATLAKQLAKIIYLHTGMQLQTAQYTRNLGVVYSASSRRRAVLQNKRHAKGIRRMKKISKLAKAVSKARGLLQTGALPQGLWGHQNLGISPTAMKTIRSNAAACTAIGGHGRCATTALALSLGHKNDPAITTALSHLSMYFDTLRSMDRFIRGLTVRNWSNIYNRVVRGDGSVAWGKVISIISGTVATLTQHGWNCERPLVWKDHNDLEWTLDLNYPRALYKPVLTSLQQSILSQLWTQASLHEMGGGLSKGVDWTGTLALHKYLNNSNSTDTGIDPDETSESWPVNPVAWLELFLVAGYWPCERTLRLMGRGDGLCPRCGGNVLEDAFHLIWDCPANLTIEASQITDSQPLLEQARAGHRDLPAFWLRGLLPLSTVPCNTPYIYTDELFLVGPHIPSHFWPSGVYYSDASGGKHSAVPALRRCGIGIASLSLSSDISSSFIFGAYAPLVGVEQTVPRAELYAILLVLRSAANGAKLDIRSDSKTNVDLFYTTTSNTLASTNGDLWHEAWQLIDSKSLDVTLKWVKGHCESVDVATRFSMTIHDIYGNACADRLADRAAQAYEVAPQDALDLSWFYGVVRRIQARAIIILSVVIPQRSTVPPAPLCNPRKPVTPMGVAIFNSAHTFHKVGPSMRCSVCFEVAPLMTSHFRDWLASPCCPDSSLRDAFFSGKRRPVALPTHRPLVIGRRAAHSSHTLLSFRGLVFCKRCGYFAVNRFLKLAEPCELANPEEARKRVLHLLRGKLPHGVPSWPNEDTIVDVYDP